jgi:hypothetical protein
MSLSCPSCSSVCCRRTRRQLSPDVRLDAGYVGDVSARHRKHHEAAMWLLDEQSLGAQLEQCLTNGCDADSQLGRELLEAHVLSGGVGAFEDPPPDVSRDVL